MLSATIRQRVRELKYKVNKIADFVDCVIVLQLAHLVNLLTAKCSKVVNLILVVHLRKCSVLTILSHNI